MVSSMCLCILLWFHFCQFHVCECVCDTNRTMYIKTNGIKRPLPFINHRDTFTTLRENHNPYLHHHLHHLQKKPQLHKCPTTYYLHSSYTTKQPTPSIQHPTPSHVSLPYSKLNLRNNDAVGLPMHSHQPPHLPHISSLNPPKLVQIGPCSSRAP